MAKIAKRTKAARSTVEGKSNLSIEEAVSLVKSNATAKFDETIEIAMNLGVDPRHADQMVRGVVALPNGTGKAVRVAVFARGPKADEAQEAGADIVGAEDLMETIQGGTIEFDRCIATPDMMPIVGRLGKILGPRNLMPNPRVGTVTMDVKQAVQDAKGGQVQFKAEKAGVVHAGVGKASFEEAKIVENVKAFVDAVNKAKPSGAKGTYMKSISLASTMGPGVTIDVAGAPASVRDGGWSAIWPTVNPAIDGDRIRIKAFGRRFWLVSGRDPRRGRGLGRSPEIEPVGFALPNLE